MIPEEYEFDGEVLVLSKKERQDGILIGYYNGIKNCLSNAVCYYMKIGNGMVLIGGVRSISGGPERLFLEIPRNYEREAFLALSGLLREDVEEMRLELFRRRNSELSKILARGLREIVIR